MNQKIEEIITIIKQLEAIIRRDYKAKIIGLFGSYARNE